MASCSLGGVHCPYATVLVNAVQSSPESRLCRHTSTLPNFLTVYTAEPLSQIVAARVAVLTLTVAAVQEYALDVNKQYLIC